LINNRLNVSETSMTRYWTLSEMYYNAFRLAKLPETAND